MTLPTQHFYNPHQQQQQHEKQHENQVAFGKQQNHHYNQQVSRWVCWPCTRKSDQRAPSSPTQQNQPRGHTTSQPMHPVESYNNPEDACRRSCGS